MGDDDWQRLDLEEALPRLRSNDGTLTRLSLNEIGDEGARELAGALRENAALARLDLRCNEIGAEGARALADSLKGNDWLAHLDLSRNDIGDEGAGALAVALKENAALAHLDLRWNQIGDDGARVLADGLRVNSALQYLNLARNEIGDEGARELAGALRDNAALAHLELGSNEIGAEGARELAGALKENVALVHLNLMQNGIGAEGARALAGALKENTALAQLKLWSNGIGDDGACALAGALKENTTLARLELWSNGIGDEGARALGDGLKENTALAHLALGGSRIGDEGARALADGLKESTNTALTYLGLEVNEIGHEGACAEGYIGGWTSRNKLLQLHRDGVQKEGFDFYFGKNGKGSSGADSLRVEETVWKAAATGDGLVLGLVQGVLKKHLAEYTEGVLKTEQESLKRLFDGARSPEGSPLLHLAAGLDSGGALDLCKFLVEEIRVDFDTVADRVGRTARDVALGNANAETSNWAKSVGTFLGRYLVEERGKYRSATCTVHFAVDVEKSKGDPDRDVAIKIMYNPEQFEREMNQRLREYFRRSGVDVGKGSNRFHENHVVPLLRYHDEEVEGSLCYCLVMRKGQRNLDEVLRYEGIAGHEIHAIIFFAVDIAEALKHLHSEGIIHGDLKPMNIVRIHGDYKLIDFDASMIIGGILTEKSSTAYLPPEKAKVIFRPRESEGDLIELKEQLEEEKNKAIIADNDDALAEILAKLKEVKKKVEQINSLTSATPEEKLRADAQMDVWSYGVVMYQMLTGRSLFDCDKNGNILNDQAKNKLLSWKGIAEDDLSHVLVDCQDQDLVDSAKDLLRKCLSTQGTRPKSFEQVLALPFLKRENLQSQKLIGGRQEIKEGQQKIKLTTDRLEVKLDGLEAKLPAALSEMEARFKIVSTTMSIVLRNFDAPKLLFLVPEDTSWGSWDINAFIGKKVRIIFICPVSLSVPRDAENKLMGYSMTLPHDWAKKYGPALKISLDMLKVAFAVAKLATGLPLPNLESAAKSTTFFKVINQSVVSCMGKNEYGHNLAPDLDELEKTLVDKLSPTLPDEGAIRAARETMGTIKTSYEEVQKIAHSDSDPNFFKTGLTKVVSEKDGSAEYVLNNTKTVSLYNWEGEDCIRLEYDKRTGYGIDFDTVVKQGWLKKNKGSERDETSSWKQRYFVLRKSGLLTSYKTKQECDKDPLGVAGTTKPKNVVEIDFGDTWSNRQLEQDEIAEGNFFMNYDGGLAEMFQALEENTLTSKEVASAWVNEARPHLLSPSQGYEI